MKKEKVYLEEIVTIEKIVSGGYGLSHLANSQVIMVKNTLPGEKVKVRFKETKKDFCFGHVIEFITPSPDRIEPVCPLFGMCGGCQYQMVDYPYQLTIKQSIIKESLQRIGKMDTDSILKTITASPKPFHYRNKGSFQVFKQGHVGFCKPGTTFPFSVPFCYLMEEPINQQLKEFSENPEKRETIKHLKSLNIRSNSNAEVISSLKKRDSFYDQVENLNFLVDVDTFFQVNRWIIPLWLEYIKQQVTKYSKGDTLLDLYCGVGIIGQYLSPLFKNVVGLEINKRLVENGKKVLEVNNINNMQIIEKDAAEYWEETPHIDTVIINPPRSGLNDNMIQALLIKQPSVIVYSSCNPDTFARDIHLLSTKGPYIIEDITPFDMFPQTSHAEIVTILHKK